MKYALLSLSIALLAAAARAEEEGTPDPIKLWGDLTIANEVEDVTKIDLLTKHIAEVGKTSKDREVCDKLAKELANSLKVCRGNWGTLGKIVDALGELRSKYGAKALRRLATQRRVEEGHEEELQAKAVFALGMMADRRLIGTLEDLCKSRSTVVAKAAYETFKHYSTVKGRTRKKCAEILMKRLQAEKPSQGGGATGGGGTISAEAQERWNKLAGPIVASMQAICREPTINDVENWREWWRENKRNRDVWKDDEKS